MLGGALAPLIAGSLVAATGTSLSVSLYVAAMSLISFISVILITQTDVAEGSRDMSESGAES